MPGSRSLVVLILAASLWSAGYALEFLSPNLQMKLFWARFQYFGITVIPVAWLTFAHRYMESHEWPRSMTARLWLGLIPLLTVILVWTNDSHHLVWQATHLQTNGPLRILELHHGPWFWVYWLYGSVLLAWGTYRLAKTLLGSVRLYRWQIGLALLACAIPWIGNVFYVLHVSPVEYLDWTPFGFVIAGLLLAVSLFRYQLANIPPIAHQQVFTGQADRLLVLDIRNFIVDLNPAAQKVVGSSGGEPIG
ncbi:MAG TPA: histidine kinase N-terminal 7TM domain-containing protein, partial [Anaerolineales bacterium]